MPSLYFGDARLRSRPSQWIKKKKKGGLERWRWEKEEDQDPYSFFAFAFYFFFPDRPPLWGWLSKTTAN